MSEHFNELTPAQAERLAMLAEECSEVIQIVCKILRHGYESCHPRDQYQVTNRDHLLDEIVDVIAVVSAMGEAKDIPDEVGEQQIDDAWAKKLRYAHHQDRAP